ncbi:circularly permuted type 2 ATP-grasp protein [Kaistia dalseonensis]|uniref:Circularly permuted ATP-grasp superfamily protein/putative alpha-E superfamily protein n=1 Tax=Kaistia dalseonensis TaxID=410840 RepID=A0ABU0H707_9HYPH|nr:circularly permuted type 2 ATP-grasp protein [Kaistia dalseonensis]MCX5495086.1 circularly permuted type 2 ATP-grasp protein [Kaistia dalseonensis]MDQ0437668.1 putative circularly permuted ATP-grasp superfamily protein/putative alpha-E superfamily protein [Kaistia dalseonensis]
MVARTETPRRGRAAADRALRLVAHYRPLPGVADEFIDKNGRIRPHWMRFVETMAALGPGEVEHRFELADRHLADSGVVFRVYGAENGDERPWPLSHVPFLIEPNEWRHLEAGLIQRAKLLDTILGDVYDEGKLAADGALPAAIIAGSPEFLRPLVGSKPVGGHHLRIYAVDVGRGPDGRWWVISDRTQAPSGAGYALENRIALSRALPDVYRSFNVERLAGFFQDFRSGLNALNRHEETRVALLTPGPLNETYFEHAYLARYLGFVLVEGEDLTVRDDTVYMRTISGLKRADVLLRRLDADFADPLELNPASRLGVPGLAGAIRQRNVAIANALGSGIIEARAMMGFIPGLAERILGEKLILPNVATWWCGQTLERDHVLAEFDRMVIAPALGATVPGILERGPVLGGDLEPEEKEKLIAAIARRGSDFVGQEVVKLSTTPVWRGTGDSAHLEPRPSILRLYVARSADGWTVMPGGFCRISDRPDARAMTLQQGGASADVWVMSDRPVAETTLLASPDKVALRRVTSTLPSRAAENLFWLGRYVERTEAALRIIRAIAGRLVDEGGDGAAVTARLVAILIASGAASTNDGPMQPAPLALSALTDRKAFNTVPRLAEASRRAASVIRDRLSPDAWRAVADLEILMQAPLESRTGSDMLERANEALRLIAAFSGLAQENMVRHNGWRFLELGRRIDRGLAVARATRYCGLSGQPAELDALLELADSQITYRIRYVMEAARMPVVDLVLLDAGNPRALAFQADRIRQSLADLPAHAPAGILGAADRLATRLSTELGTADVADLDHDTIFGYETALMRISDEIALAYFTHRRATDPTEAGD